MLPAYLQIQGSNQKKKHEEVWQIGQIKRVSET